jgi:hypothetical protein
MPRQSKNQYGYRNHSSRAGWMQHRNTKPVRDNCEKYQSHVPRYSGHSLPTPRYRDMLRGARHGDTLGCSCTSPPPLTCRPAASWYLVEIMIETRGGGGGAGCPAERKGCRNRSDW